MTILAIITIVNFTNCSSNNEDIGPEKPDQEQPPTTFWLNTKAKKESQPVAGTQPEGIEDGKYEEELDICEVIGRTKDGESWQKNMLNRMNSNVHFKLCPSSGAASYQHDQDKTANITIPNGKTAADDYNIYGCWWHDKTYLVKKGETTISKESAFEVDSFQIK